MRAISDRIKDNVRDAIAGEDIRGPLAFIRESLPRDAVFYIMGGAIRNIIIRMLHGGSPITKDIDMLIGNIDPGLDLAGLFPAHETERIDLGGVRWNPVNSKYAFDLCHLSEFFIIKKYHLDSTPETLVSTLDFTMNAAVYDINRRLLFENHCIDAIANRVIEFNSELFFNKMILTYRILAMRHKTHFVLSGNVYHFLKTAVDLDTWMEAKRLLIDKLGKNEAMTVIGEYNRLMKTGNYCAYPGFADSIG